MRRAIVLIAVCALLLAASSQAQAPQGPPKPGPEVKRMAYYIGTWKTEGEVKKDAFGPGSGGKVTSTDKCEWLSGGFFSVCHSDGTTPEGAIKALSVMGYDPIEKVYTYHEFNSTGEAISAKGKVTGDTWNWTSPDSKMGNDTISVRVTTKEVSKTEYTFKLEMSTNGGAWTTAEEAKSTKVTPAAPAKK